MWQDVRGVSSVLGVALLFGMVMAGVLLVVVVGGTALEETRGGLDTERAEKTMTQFDSRSAMVALGTTSHQGVDLAAGDDDYGVDPDAGWMNVTIYNATADEHAELTNVTLGAVVYENGDDRIVYQGGGVWKRSDAGVNRLSPPEFHFRDATLTLPIITVDGRRSLGENAEVVRADSTRLFYPNATRDENFTNPMDDGHVNVTVQSEYYEAWGRYFEQRTEGNVSYDHDAETARVKLVVPFNESYENALATTQPDGIGVDGNDDPPEPNEEGTNYPLADERIENRIDECQTDPSACDDLPATNEMDDSRTYYADSDITNTDDLVVNDPGGDVTLVVNGDFDPSSVTIHSTTDANLTVLVRGSFTMGSLNSINYGGDPEDLAVLVHSDGSVSANGNSQFAGLGYAPGSDCSLNGGGAVDPNIKGGFVCETADLHGNPVEFEYDSSIENIELALADEVTPITYLHVTENPINVTSD